MTQADNHRQLLMHCLVVNPAGESSQRFVDHTVFELWRTLIAQRHSLRVEQATPCVWVPEAECRRQDRLFAHSPHYAAVTRLEARCYHDDSGVAETKVRFLADDDLAWLQPRLARQLLGGADYSNVSLAAGAAISTLPAPRVAQAEPSWSIPRGFAPVRSAMRW